MPLKSKIKKKGFETNLNSAKKTLLNQEGLFESGDVFS